MDPRRGNGESGGHLTPYLDSSKRWKAPLWSRAWSLASNHQGRWKMPSGGSNLFLKKRATTLA